MIKIQIHFCHLTIYGDAQTLKAMNKKSTVIIIIVIIIFLIVLLLLYETPPYTTLILRVLFVTFKIAQSLLRINSTRQY